MGGEEEEGGRGKSDTTPLVGAGGVTSNLKFIARASLSYCCPNCQRPSTGVAVRHRHANVGGRHESNTSAVKVDFLTCALRGWRTPW